ncbi:hypothetical protein NUU61_004807 [Penicillium alfredii]|uniref:Uncharacterized protein n=1 Tax=Penicillium alfredii TaxID=1506179 RepID=A0A9W9F8A3_9EURO|nr:uncharacterized protein NUU61_004807 [Penicillium alfredii]KAJ5095451.1 hypothetical protein NUU61_004807 [Penicillium alfredii]
MDDEKGPIVHGNESKQFKRRGKHQAINIQQNYATKATANATIVVENLTDAFPAAPVKTGATALLVLPWKVLTEAAVAPVLLQRKEGVHTIPH